MPYARARRYRPRGKRPLRRFKRRYVRRYAKRSLRKQQILLGKSQVYRLKYESTYVLTPALDPGVEHLWRANSLYDPDYTGAGHQPRGFDQLMQMFDHYTVIGAKITVRLVNTAPETQGALAILTLEDDFTATTALANLRERTGANVRILATAGSAAATQTLTKGFSAKKFFARGPRSSDDLRGDATTNPTEGAFWKLNLSRQSATVPSSPVEIYVNIVYTALFSEPKLPPIS